LARARLTGLALSKHVIQPFELEATGDLIRHRRAASQHVVEILVVHTDQARLIRDGQAFAFQVTLDQLQQFGVGDDGDLAHHRPHRPWDRSIVHRLLIISYRVYSKIVEPSLSFRRLGTMDLAIHRPQTPDLTRPSGSDGSN